MIKFSAENYECTYRTSRKGHEGADKFVCSENSLCSSSVLVIVGSSRLPLGRLLGETRKIFRYTIDKSDVIESAEMERSAPEVLQKKMRTTAL